MKFEKDVYGKCTFTGMCSSVFLENAYLTEKYSSSFLKCIDLINMFYIRKVADPSAVLTLFVCLFFFFLIYHFWNLVTFYLTSRALSQLQCLSPNLGRKSQTVLIYVSTLMSQCQNVQSEP